ncbi:MAG: mechanosensitive ion channel family protein [Candidatus Micrarchaeota archaeon]|nr:mechanosensitive ion channel family protein [Candidatus Micrarchaeota archaeon]MBU1682185.1 mechanosensitive ion channel family protein [Candidatus Micrarchaeota archaeon]
MAFEQLLENYLSPEILTYQIGDNFAIAYLSALLVFLLSILILRIFKFVIVRRLKKFAENTTNKYDDLFVKLLDKIGWPLYLVFSLHVSFQFISLPAELEEFTYAFMLLMVGYYLIRSAGYIIDFVANKIIDGKKKRSERVDKGAVNLLANMSKGVLWSLVILLVLSNLGYDMSTLLTGLGIGGIAIALALQTVLTDVFSYFSIHLDKPFKVGDFLMLGSDMGTVEKIGIKSTRIRTLQGQELVISNKELTDSRINNFKKMEKRRISFTFGIGCDTPTKKIRQVPGTIKAAIEKLENVQFDRVHFQKFGDSSLIFEVVYFMTTPEFNVYMDTQQTINLAIMEELEKAKIEIPFPTQTIYLPKRP